MQCKAPIVQTKVGCNLMQNFSSQGQEVRRYPNLRFFAGKAGWTGLPEPIELKLGVKLHIKYRLTIFFESHCT